MSTAVVPPPIWELDWSAQPSFDYQAAGNGTYSIGGNDVGFFNMARATVWRIVNGVGMECEALDGTSYNMNGATPTAPNMRVFMDDVEPDPTKYGEYPWIVWWEISSWALPANGNAVNLKCVNGGSNFGLSCGFGGGIRAGDFSSGSPTAAVGVQTQTNTAPHVSRRPGAEDWRVLAVAFWGRVQGVSMLGGPLAGWGNLEQMWEFGASSLLGSTVVAAGQFPINPWGGQLQFGLPTQTTAAGRPTAVVKRTMVTRGWEED